MSIGQPNFMAAVTSQDTTQPAIYLNQNIHSAKPNWRPARPPASYETQPNRSSFVFNSSYLSYQQINESTNQQRFNP